MSATRRAVWPLPPVSAAALRRVLPHLALALLFVAVSGRLALAAWDAGWIGVDARIYYRGSAAWLAGGSPWEALDYFNGQPAHYSALPTAVVVLSPLTILPESIFTVLFLGASAAAAIFVVRRSGLPWYFVLFPPLFQGVQTGNPNAIVLALLVSGRPGLEAVAPLLKVYAAIPLVGRGRWRSMLWALLLGALTLLAVPLWVEYASHVGTYSARLLDEASGGFSAAGFGPLSLTAAAAGVAALWLRDREAAAWLAVPALWPATQFHYSIFAMPLMRDRLWLAAILALPVPMVPALMPAVLAVAAYAHHRVHARPASRPG